MLTVEQQKERLIWSYMESLRMFREVECFSKFVPLQKRACNIIQKACNSNHDLRKLHTFLCAYLEREFNAM